jgi:hypothetical protein
MNPLVIPLSGAERVLWKEDGGGDLTNVQCKANQNCHNEYLLYKECILTKMGKKLHCVYMPYFLNPFISCGTSSLFPKLGYCE